MCQRPHSSGVVATVSLIVHSLSEFERGQRRVVARREHAKPHGTGRAIATRFCAALDNARGETQANAAEPGEAHAASSPALAAHTLVLFGERSRALLSGSLRQQAGVITRPITVATRTSRQGFMLAHARLRERTALLSVAFSDTSAWVLVSAEPLGPERVRDAARYLVVDRHAEIFSALPSAVVLALQSERGTEIYAVPLFEPALNTVFAESSR